MNKEIIVIDNLKCGGCANIITEAIKKLDGVIDVKVNHETSEVIIEKSKPIKREVIIEKLTSLGYPEAGNSNLIHKAKSYVSCAIGRVVKGE